MPPKQAPVDLTDIPSPTRSIGPTTVPSIDHEVLQATRKGTSTKTLSQPRGFSNPAQECYRNAIIVMLLNSDSFMSFVQNWHANCITRQRDSGSPKSKAKKSTIDCDYTDLLLQLQELWAVYWEDQEETALGEAMNEFWTYATSLEELAASAVRWDVTKGTGTHLGQQDASEFFLWFLTMHKARLENFRLNDEADSLDSVIRTGFRERRRCKNCLLHKDINEKRRFTPYDEDFWRVDTQDYRTTDSVSGRTVKLEDLLEYQTKTLDETSYCEACQQEYETMKKAMTSKERAAADKDKVAGKDKKWKNVAFLPEVFFMYLTRFGSEDSSNGKKEYHKEDTKVTIPETLDLTSILDKYVSQEENSLAKYRLVGVILHAGNLQRGHYINYTRTIDGKWWRIDNEDVKEIDFAAVNEEEDWGASRSGKRTARSQPFEASMLAWERIAEKSTAPQPISSKKPTKVTKSEALKSSTATIPFEGKHDALPEEPKARAAGYIRGFVTLAGRRYYIPEIPVALPATFHRQANSKSGFKLPLIELRLEVPDPKHPANLLSYDLCDANEDEKVLQEHDACQNGGKPLAGDKFYAGSTRKHDDVGKDPEEGSKTAPGAKQGSIKETTKTASNAAPGRKQQAPKKPPKQGPVSGSQSPTEEKPSKIAAEQDNTRTSPRLQEKALKANQVQKENDTATASKMSEQPTSNSPKSKAPEPMQGRDKQSSRIEGDDPTMGFEDDPEHHLRSPKLQKKPPPQPSQKSSTKSKTSTKSSGLDQPEPPTKSSARPSKKPPTTKKAPERRSESDQPKPPSKPAPKPSKKAVQEDKLSTDSDDLEDFIAKEAEEKVGKRKRYQQEKYLDNAFISDDEGAPAKKKGKGGSRKKR